MADLMRRSQISQVERGARASAWQFPLFVALGGQRDATVGRGRLSKPFLRIAMAAVTISVAAMLIAFAVARGFQREVGARTLLFAGDIQLVNLDANASYEQRPIARAQSFLPALRKMKGIRTVEPFAVKAGIIKTKEQMQGCVLKGVEIPDALNDFLPFLVRGRLPQQPEDEEDECDEVMISAYMANLLQLDTGKALVMYFVQQPPRVRRFDIVGVYDTQMREFDAMYVLGDLRHVQALNEWDESQIGGYEVRVNGLQDLATLFPEVEGLCAYGLQQDGTLLRVVDAREKYASIFDWLALLDTNVIVLLTLMLAVAGVNMVTALLILILERTQEIGLLKALGATGRQLRTLFVIRATRILLWGLCAGNAVGLGILLMQRQFKFVRLDPSEYYIDHVPVEMGLGAWAAINGITLAVTLVVLLVPSGLVARVSPGESMRFA